MRNLILVALLLLSTAAVTLAAPSVNEFEPSLKYGKPTDEELQMTVYTPDTAANAVVLYSKYTARYDYVANGFRIVYFYETKIKVLKSEGTSYADISISFYNDEKSNNFKETVNQIDASAYNLEDGK